MTEKNVCIKNIIHYCPILEASCVILGFTASFLISKRYVGEVKFVVGIIIISTVIARALGFLYQESLHHLMLQS